MIPFLKQRRNSSSDGSHGIPKLEPTMLCSHAAASNLLFVASSAFSAANRPSQRLLKFDPLPSFVLGAEYSSRDFFFSHSHSITINRKLENHNKTIGIRYGYSARESQNSKTLALCLTLTRSNRKTFIYISLEDLADQPSYV